MMIRKRYLALVLGLLCLGAVGQIETRKAAFNSEGGRMVRLTNKTGAASVKGTMVTASSTTDDAVEITSADEESTIGVIYEDGVADGSEVWVVTGGRAQVLLENSAAGTRGYWVRAAAGTAGRVTTEATPNLPEHEHEVRHSVQTISGGTDVLLKMNLHFN